MKAKRVVVAGGRRLKVTDGRIAGVIDLLKRLAPDEIVSGGASGGDQIGEIAARRLDIPVTCFKPHWDRLGRSAGPMRNEKMARYAAAKPGGACVLLPGGAGTADMERRARDHGLRVIKVVWEEESGGTLE